MNIAAEVIDTEIQEHMWASPPRKYSNYGKTFLRNGKNPRGGPHIHYNAMATAGFIIRTEAAKEQQPAHVHNDIQIFANGQALMDCRNETTMQGMIRYAGRYKGGQDRKEG